MKFAEGFHTKIEVPAGARDIQVFDDELPGFGMRKFASGACSYFVKFNVGSQQRRKSLGAVTKGNLKAMRLEASAVLAKARLGTDVVAEAEAAAAKSSVPTLGKLVPLYLAAREPELRAKSMVEITRYLEQTWKPLHGRPIDAIARKEIVLVIDGMAGKVAADRARAALSGLFGWAIDRSYVEANPTMNVRARAQNGARKRVLSEPELVTIWKACETGGGDMGRIVRLLMLTGQRRSEIGDLRHSEIDLDRRQILLAEIRTKNARAHIIPISGEAAEIIKATPRGESDYLFGRGNGYKGWDEAKSDLDKRLGAMPHWTLHDLRRSFVTHVGENGFAQPHVIEAIVNHVSGSKAGVAGIYNRAVYLPERIQALDLWGAHITALVAGGPGKVVAMRKRA